MVASLSNQGFLLRDIASVNANSSHFSFNRSGDSWIINGDKRHFICEI